MARPYRLPIIRLLCLLGGVLLGGCNLPSQLAPTQVDADMLYTAAAQTIVAQNTIIARQNPTITLAPVSGQPSQTLVPQSPLPQPSPAATQIPAPGETQTAAPTSATAEGACDLARFVEDVTVPDGTRFDPGEQFTKTWRLENTGTCTWTSEYAVVFAEGEALDALATQPLTSGSVRPGEKVDISIQMKAPDLVGEYQGDWQLRNASGVRFGLGSQGDKTFWVRIQVGAPSGIGLDFIARASSADWMAEKGSSLFDLPYNGDRNSNDGFAGILENVVLEDGRTSGKILATYPPQENDSQVQGTFSAYLVQPGDHLVARIGFLANSDGTCGSGSVVFRLRYKEGNTVKQLGEWDKLCNRRLQPIDIDLSDLKGKTVQFILSVFANGSPSGDLAIWNSPRIER